MHLQDRLEQALGELREQEKAMNSLMNSNEQLTLELKNERERDLQEKNKELELRISDLEQSVREARGSYLSKVKNLEEELIKAKGDSNSNSSLQKKINLLDLKLKSKDEELLRLRTERKANLENQSKNIDLFKLENEISIKTESLQKLQKRVTLLTEKNISFQKE